MPRPKRYAVKVTVWADDKSDCDLRTAEFSNLLQAKAFAERHSGQVYERSAIHDATPATESPGLLWEYEERLIETP